jgi:hypothetical protein
VNTELLKGLTMFDWFKRPKYTEQTTATDDMLGTGDGEFHPTPYIPFPKVETPVKDPVNFYTIGPTDDNRLTLKVGHTTLTMNRAATLSLIKLLQVAMDNLSDESEE